MVKSTFLLSVLRPRAIFSDLMPAFAPRANALPAYERHVFLRRVGALRDFGRRLVRGIVGLVDGVFILV